MTDQQLKEINTGLGMIALLLFALFGLGMVFLDQRLRAIEAVLGIVR